MFTKSILIGAMTLTVSAGAFAQNTSTMKSINNNAPVVCSKSITIQAKREKIWAVLSDINHWANWQADVSKSKINGDLKQEATFNWKTGGVKIHSTIHTVDPDSQLGWTGKTYGMYAIHNWTLTEKNGVTTVYVEESMQGFLAGLFKKKFNKDLEKGMINWLELLKTECENKNDLSQIL